MADRLVGLVEEAASGATALLLGLFEFSGVVGLWAVWATRIERNELNRPGFSGGLFL